ncbi:YbhB/YbcL family Raf kinase inhibitor-like protein [Haladaptatus pallidirubidus]|uniref:YbhB/YbcL family Raf kinase inhibitor-like protein n=1 Tax=Haladaptatus pallidirubidus TaxID=1008152 RepID=A0AAV3UDF4_9EURY|nr:YbhB/YbcL family Raf kinase inhibitor-like protein [Haladaptatus pallidirubidus]
MLRRRAFLRAMGGIGVVVSGIRGTNKATGKGRSKPAQMGEQMVQFSTPAFEDGNRIPQEFTCEGQNISPPLDIESVPDEVNSLAIIVDDPDAPSGTFTHWAIWDIPPDTKRIPRGVPGMEIVADLGGAKHGENDAGELGYLGPCPPMGDSSHTYRFTLYLLERQPRLGAGATKSALLDAMGGIRLGQTRFTGEFERG